MPKESTQWKHPDADGKSHSNTQKNEKKKKRFNPKINWIRQVVDILYVQWSVRFVFCLFVAPFPFSYIITFIRRFISNFYCFSWNKTVTQNDESKMINDITFIQSAMLLGHGQSNNTADSSPQLKFEFRNNVV